MFRTRNAALVLVGAVGCLAVVIVASLVPGSPSVRVAGGSDAAVPHAIGIARPLAPVVERVEPRPTAAPPAEAGPGADDSSGDPGTDGGSAAPAPPSTGLPEFQPAPPVLSFGLAAEITWISVQPYPATCGGSFTVGADVWDDVGVVSATLWMDGVQYPMSSNVPTTWFVNLPVPPGAELIGGVGFTVAIRDGDGMGDDQFGQVNVTC